MKIFIGNLLIFRHMLSVYSKILIKFSTSKKFYKVVKAVKDIEIFQDFFLL